MRYHLAPLLLLFSATMCNAADTDTGAFAAEDYRMQQQQQSQPQAILPTQLPDTVIRHLQPAAAPNAVIVAPAGATPLGTSSNPLLLTTQQPNGHSHHRICGYQTGSGVWVNSANNGPGCPLVGNPFIPIYGRVYVAPVVPIPSEITDQVANDEFVIDNNRIIFTNLWHGTCHQSECSLAAGYIAANPLSGVVLMTQPALSATPVLIFAPKASGPVRIVSADISTGLISLQSQGGNFAVEDAKGQPTQQTLTAPGGDNFIFDLSKAKFVQP